jgi:protein-S-isoprenylcysteine O-methyltransferase Ste14
MSLLKIPFLLLTAYYVDVSCTRQPSAPPTHEECVVLTSKIERALVWAGPSLAVIIRVCTVAIMQRSVSCSQLPQPYAWAPAIAETVSILVNDLLPRELQLKLPRVLSASESTFRITGTFVAGVIIALLGARFRLGAFRTLGKHFKLQLSMQSDHKLATTGPYNVVRHPGYTGYFAALLGVNVAWAAPGGWLRDVIWPWLAHDADNVARVTVGTAALAVCGRQLLAVVALSRRMAEEDKMMRTRFGTEWEEWATRVPYKLVPGVY